MRVGAESIQGPPRNVSIPPGRSFKAITYVIIGAVLLASVGGYIFYNYVVSASKNQLGFSKEPTPLTDKIPPAS